jgi:cytochrome bd ubiquinol oxidase subunit I
VFDFHNFSGDESVPGLKTIPEDLQPTVAPVFWGFRLIIYGAWAMFSVAFIGVIVRLRRRLYTERWFLRRSARSAPRLRRSCQRESP